MQRRDRVPPVPSSPCSSSSRVLGLRRGGAGTDDGECGSRPRSTRWRTSPSGSPADHADVELPHRSPARSRTTSSSTSARPPRSPRPTSSSSSATSSPPSTTPSSRTPRASRSTRPTSSTWCRRGVPRGARGARGRGARPRRLRPALLAGPAARRRPRRRGRRRARRDRPRPRRRLPGQRRGPARRPRGARRGSTPPGWPTASATRSSCRHDAFGYLEKYDVHIAPLVGLSPDAEPTPAVLGELQELIDDGGDHHRLQRAAGARPGRGPGRRPRPRGPRPSTRSRD